MLNSFEISRSLSKKGYPYDNAFAEATIKIIKTEFVKNEEFETLNELRNKLADYVNWFNCHRILSTLDYLTPVQFKENTLKKLSSLLLTIHCCYLILVASHRYR